MRLIALELETRVELTNNHATFKALGFSTNTPAQRIPVMITDQYHHA